MGIRNLSFDDTKALQIYLNRLGFPTKVDGDPGPKTEIEFKKLMVVLEEPEDSDLTPRLMELIHTALAAGVRVPTPTEEPVVEEFVPVEFVIKSKRRLHPAHKARLIVKAKQLFGLEFQKACETKNAMRLKSMAGMCHAALKVREKTNNNDGEIVEQIQYTGYGQKGWAWCMYQEQTDIVFAELLTGITSKYYMSGSCAEVRANTPASMQIELKDLIQGDSVVWWYPTTGTGHVGGFQSWIERLVSMLCTEGNTTAGKLGDAIVREGGGSYNTERSASGTGTMKIKMLIRPF